MPARGRRWLDVFSWVALVAAGLFALAAVAFLLPPLNLAARFAAPAFCASCHNMRPEYAAFRASVHRSLPSCNECHLPNDNGVSHQAWSGVFGARDVWQYYILGDAPYDATATPASQAIIQANCYRCHNGVLGHTDVSRRCWDCHRVMYHRFQLETQPPRAVARP